ncbi:hypothetical protein FHR95_001213 [Halomonas fontilapidosi]|uniref:Uncharacterized protein n=1 Tax=Halomonas fontilapidosi TaxID=616675 RepID=A0A7W5DIR2_9GAMM|nr:hypothetical protein [Halomonas fontilapidosi]
MPLLQWRVLPPLILWLSSRHFIGTAALMTPYMKSSD